jgi:predicted aspartyl protease
VNAAKTLGASFLGIILLNPGMSAAKTHITNTPSADGHQMRESAIPVTVRSGFLAIVAGQIGGQKHNFVVDTGTAPSVLNARLAKKMGLEVRSGALVAAGRWVITGQAVLPELELGPIHATNLSVTVMNLSAWEEKLGIEIAGLVGMDVLGRTDFRLDYDRKELAFGGVATDGIAVGYDGLRGLALAEATVQGKRVRLIVDTGSDLVVVYGENWGTREAAGQLSPWLEGNGISVAERVGVRPIAKPEMELDGKQFRGLRTYYVPSAAVTGYDGFFGVRALKLRGISFDRATQTMYLLN